MGSKFVVTDSGANDVLSTASQLDKALKRAVPLKITEDGGNYRLYAGKKYAYSLDTGESDMAEALRGGVEKTLIMVDPIV